MLLDSNLIIYSTMPEYDSLRDFIDHQSHFISIISQVEVLGYHKLIEKDREKLEQFFQFFPILPISSPIVEQAIDLRQQQKMSLGDALIAATALIHDLQLATANVKDFSWIDGIEVVNPVEIV